MATIAQLRKGLAATTLPDDLTAALIKGASPLWLSSDSAVQLAEDLALAHPPLKSKEVRARAIATDNAWRLTVLAHDRKGLLADTATILANDGYCIVDASVATWLELDLAIHSVTVNGAVPSDDTLNALGAAIQAATGGTRPTLKFEPVGRAYVKRTGDANGFPMISVVAPDQPGLLAKICRWFSTNGISIQAAWITGEGDANDVFVVKGDVNVAALEQVLTAAGEGNSIAEVAGDMFSQALEVGEAVVKNATDFLRGLLTRK